MTPGPGLNTTDVPVTNDPMLTRAAIPARLARPPVGRRALRKSAGFAVTLNRGGRDPLLQQLARSITERIGQGTLLLGDRLPGERALAKSLGLSRNTVSAAYELLETQGLIRRLSQRGAFVSQQSSASATPLRWSDKVAQRAHVLDEPVLELLAQGSFPSSGYKLSAGTPLISCFPQADYRAAIDRVLTSQAVTAISMAPTEGQPRLRQAIAAQQKVDPARVLIVAGAQEGIDLLARCFIDPGDAVVMERPTYPGAIQAFRAAGAVLHEWDTKEWSAHALERLLMAHRPKFIFTMPTHHNPTSRTMTQQQRVELLETAARHQVPVIEDDVYSQTTFDNVIPPSLLALDQSNIVISLSTFSKLLAPGLRIGWIVAPLRIVKQLSLIKMRANLFTEGLGQLALAEMIENGTLASHLVRLRQKHLALKTIAVRELRKNFSAGEISFAEPLGGLYLWCRLSQPRDQEALLVHAQRLGTSFAPDRAFYAGTPDAQYLRLCFSATDAAGLPDAIRLLAQACRTEG